MPNAPPIVQAPIAGGLRRGSEPPLRLLPASPELANSPAWRRDPWKLFFPLGMLLAWAGVLPWFLFGIGATTSYLSIFHSIVQVQGFLICFALGFLFTFLPRRTGTPPPSALEMIVCLVAPVALTFFALQERWALSQLCWLLMLGTLVRFAISRVRRARARNQIPPAFLWVALGLLWGVAGSVLTGVGASLGEEWMWLHEAGRTLVVQGVFTGLVLGTGAFLLPAITRGTDPSRVLAGPAYRNSLLRHALGGALWTAAAFLEPLVDTRLAFALRALVTLAVVVGTLQLWRLPSMPGLNRRLVWIAGWMLPLGNLVVAFDPGLRRTGLHVVFIGCFALLVLSVGCHVSLSHGGRPSLLSTRPWQLWALAGLLLLALSARACIDLFPERGLVWFWLAAGSFLTATLCWATLALLPQRRT